MIQTLIDKFMENKSALRAALTTHPSCYKDLVIAVVSTLAKAGCELDHTRIHEIDDGDYQGTLLYVIAKTGYQPSTYWATKVDYGSCSGCDTLQGIADYSGDPPTPEQISQYMTLALHIVQGLREI